MEIKKMLEDEENGFEEEEETGEDGEMVEFEESNLKRKRLNLGDGGSGMSARAGDGDGGGGSGVSQLCCVVDKCETDLRTCKKYYQRHKVCEVHSKAPEVIASGMRQRFCQQCSRFHEISEFDQTKRSCRTRLAGHNERRRKMSSSLIKSAQTSEDSRTNNPGSLMAFSEKQSYKLARMSL